MLAKLLFLGLTGVAATSGAQEVQPLTVVDEFPDDPGDALDIASACLDGSELVLEVGHSGGCAAHSYDLLWDGRIIETFPASADLRIVHDGHGDVCEAYLMRTLRFDVSTLTALGDDLRISVLSTSDEALPVGACE